MIYSELKTKNFEIVAAAQDTAGEAAAGRWYDAAKATFTTLVDPTHAVSSAFQCVNVPTGVWIDERGRIVRPGEPAWTTDQHNTYGGKALVMHGDAYVAALRDWVDHGDRSAYAMSDEEYARRVTPRSASELEADAAFKLAVWFQRNGDRARAATYFARAQQLNPDDWNYHRQDWSFGPDAGRKWLENSRRPTRNTTRSTSSPIRRRRRRRGRERFEPRRGTHRVLRRHRARTPQDRFIAPRLNVVVQQEVDRDCLGRVLEKTREAPA
jgi:hypothetical protein